jgi:hypothetical protein
MSRFRTYTAYSIACATIWAAILIAMGIGAYPHRRTTILLVFAGWAIGWLSATIARVVYPSPKARVQGTLPSVG